MGCGFQKLNPKKQILGQGISFLKKEGDYRGVKNPEGFRTDKKAALHISRKNAPEIFLRIPREASGMPPDRFQEYSCVSLHPPQKCEANPSAF